MDGCGSEIFHRIDSEMTDGEGGGVEVRWSRCDMLICVCVQCLNNDRNLINRADRSSCFMPRLDAHDTTTQQPLR